EGQGGDVIHGGRAYAARSAHIPRHWFSLSPSTRLLAPTGLGLLFLHCRLPSTTLRRTTNRPRLPKSWMSPSTTVRAILPPRRPRSSWMLPSIRERTSLPLTLRAVTTTRRWCLPWMLPSTRTPRATRRAPLRTLTSPSTRVPSRRQVLPRGTTMLSPTATARIVPTQRRSSACAAVGTETRRPAERASVTGASNAVVRRRIGTPGSRGTDVVQTGPDP